MIYLIELLFDVGSWKYDKLVKNELCAGNDFFQIRDYSIIIRTFCIVTSPRNRLNFN